MLPLEAETLTHPPPLPLPHAREGGVARAEVSGSSSEVAQTLIQAWAVRDLRQGTPGRLPCPTLETQGYHSTREFALPWVCALYEAGCVELARTSIWDL